MDQERDTASPGAEAVRPATDVKAMLRATLLASGAAALLFLGYELVERTWLVGAEAELVHALHRVRGATAALVAGALASWLILRRAPPLLARPLPRAGLAAGRIRPEERRLHYARWFVRMRWIAVVVAAVLLVAAVYIFDLLPREVGPALAGTVALLAAANLLYALHLRRGAAASPRFLALQAYADVAILIVLLHLSGGIENPLTPLTALHVIIAAVVLDRRRTYLLAGVASGLFALLAVGEWSGLLPHYALAVYPHGVEGGEVVHAARDTLYVGSRVALQAAMLLLVAFFTTSLTERIRRDERMLESFADRSVAQAELLERALEDQKAAQAALIRSERLAALGQLAGQVAHEVNNPIAILSGKARLLLRERRPELAPAAAEEVAKIVALADRVARIAQGLLTFCRPKPGAPGPLDVRVPIRSVLSDIEARAAGSGVRIRDELPDGLPRVLANGGELEQVFLNVFHNALDAMPGGGVLRVTARSAPVEPAGGTRERPEEAHRQMEGPPHGDPAGEPHGGPGAGPRGAARGESAGVEVAVEDTGSGIPPALQDRIFEPFLTTKSGGRGSGLGLSICLGLIRSQGGQIAVESEPGRYTRVLVRLPAVGTARAPRAEADRALQEAGAHG